MDKFQTDFLIYGIAILLVQANVSLIKLHVTFSSMGIVFVLFRYQTFQKTFSQEIDNSTHWIAEIYFFI